MFGRWAVLCFLVAVSGCSCRKVEPSPPSDGAAPAKLDKPVALVGPEGHPTSFAPKVTPLSTCNANGLQPLDAARKWHDEGKFDEALSCAAQATALTPDDPLGHSERGAALASMGRLDEAQVAYARALALDPEFPDALLGAAHLYGVALPSSRERDELAAVYSERGLAAAREQKDSELTGQFALLSAMAFNDLGQARDALDRSELALSLAPGGREAAYERAVALFELCRFADAKQAFLTMLDDPERGAHAHHHLGLLLEREGKAREAAEHFAKARSLSPDDFPDPQLLPADQFKREIDLAVASLPADMRRDLDGIPVTAEELPRTDDLVSGDPPLSPAILGLFRGPPLPEPCEPEPGAAPGQPCRSVALYRLNLARAVRSREELVEQIRVTLLHEIGHLRGEDDFELAARGLE